MPTEELEFRRLERQNLLGPTQVILHVPDEYVWIRGEREDGVPVTRRVTQYRAQFVGLGEGYAVTAVVDPYTNSGRWLEYWPLEEQKQQFKLIPMGMLFGDWREEQPLEEDRYNCCGIVIPELPGGTAAAEMVLWEDGQEYRERGTWEQPGCWVFAFQSRKKSFSSDWLQGLPYELTVWGQDGEVLARQTGTVPENG